MKGKQIGLLLGAALLVAGGLAACGKSSTKTSKSGLAADQSVKLAAKAEVTTLDVSKASDSSSLTMLYHTQEGLYRLGKNEKLINALATKTTVSKDGKQYTFKLRSDNHWNDGKPVTAQDFVYSWQRTVNPKTASEYAYLMAGIKNYNAVQNGKVAPSQLGVKAVNKHTLQVTLSKPVAYFKLLLAFPTFFPQEQKVVEKYGSDYGHSSQQTAYDGPFTMTKWQGTSQSWTLKKNTKFWDKKGITLKQMHFQVVADPSTGLSLFQKKELDATTLDGTQVANLKNNKEMKTFVGGSTYYMQMNQKKVKALRNLKVRQALSMAIDKQQLAKSVLRDGSKAPLGFVSQNLSRNPKTNADFAKDAYVKSGVTYDLKQAKSLMSTGNTNNNGDFSDAKYDSYVKASENQDANNPTARYQDLVNAEKRLMSQQGVIPLYQPATVEMWNDKVSGYVWNPAGMSRGYQWMKVEK